MSDKKIAVVMSSYNGEEYIKQQLDSILSQKCKYSIDIYIRDDGSKDRTVEIIRDYQKEHSSIRLSVGKNMGYNASFFTLLKSIDGYDYYSFADQDDVWLDNKLQCAVEMMEAEEQDIPLLYGSCSYLVHDNLKPFGTTQENIRPITFYNTIIHNFLPGHSQVMNDKLNRILRDTEIDYSKLYVYDAWITNVAMVEGKLIFDNNPHTYYRQHGDNGLGFGESKLDWFTERFKRIGKSQSKKYAVQIDYFLEVYGKDLKPEYAVEMQKYQQGKKSTLSRGKYAMHTKLYRQKQSEDKLFKVLYIAGQYNA